MKSILRRIVLATAFPPFFQLYRSIYALVIRTAVRMLAAEPTVRAIYLRRGYAKGEWLPGLSDLDFQVIVDGLDNKNQERLLRKYSRFSRLAVLPDEILAIQEGKTLLDQLENPRKKYRLMEGRATWKLLYGKDYIAELPELAVEDMVSGLHSEIAVWWTIFAWRLLQSKSNQREPITCNSICYKAVAETLKVDLALNRGILTFIRDEALAHAKTHLQERD
ncbi:MAG: hypothetical protein OEU36_21255, partial [Gammaproteobacteria bacterium]|nr:hypothetical protein [Gammaproteobacteria bacterium]